MVTLLESAPQIASRPALQDLRFFYKSLEVREPFYDQLKIILERFTFVNRLFAFRYV